MGTKTKKQEEVNEGGDAGDEERGGNMGGVCFVPSLTL